MAVVHAIRHEVFVVEQQVPAELEWDGKDDRSVHVLAKGGTGRLLLDADAAAKNGGDPYTAVLGRLAVLRSARGGGIGAALVHALEDEARRLGLNGVYLESQVHAVPFYERLGYSAYGPEFTDAGIPHRAMRRDFGEAPGRSGNGRSSGSAAAPAEALRSATKTLRSGD
jgi:predicted GNAT family N-acyltransferase